ncbi:MAG: hypothetical protein AVDCRST_MAG64-1976 [uncultured Phycisphaerae bacterium]|uniref:Uncharacterized protein n=1 Tax=uncultured Phycisphaerae bacterium TaxID=904963 RepID=A0A6J4P7I3_9BACT|nr:MAG: hypothetical protein AVDCRST_MAG64-1976 [uncultured Phycisphaerae bacterium]
MGDLEFLPAWYTRKLRRRRVLAVCGAVAVLIVAILALTMSR